MPQYEVGKHWYFASVNETKNAGDTVELPEDVAANYMHNEPGLLKPTRQTTRATPDVVRDDQPAARRGRKPRKQA